MGLPDFSAATVEEMESGAVRIRGKGLELNKTANLIFLIFFGFGCFIVLFTLVFVSVLMRTGRMLSTKQGRMEFMGMKQARMLECPTCKEMVAQHELVMHLITEHGELWTEESAAIVEVVPSIRASAVEPSSGWEEGGGAVEVHVVTLLVAVVRTD